MRFVFFATAGIMAASGEGPHITEFPNNRFPEAGNGAYVSDGHESTRNPVKNDKISIFQQFERHTSGKPCGMKDRLLTIIKLKRKSVHVD
ncbi:MAG: hypothetical protein P8Z30_17790 [Acidobacteriota bacterium]